MRFVTSLVKRMSHRWHGQVNLTLSTSEGLRGTGTFGQDPNDLTNAFGRISDTDRPVMFTANGSYEIPRIDVRVSGQLSEHLGPHLRAGRVGGAAAGAPRHQNRGGRRSPARSGARAPTS